MTAIERGILDANALRDDSDKIPMSPPTNRASNRMSEGGMQNRIASKITNFMEVLAVSPGTSANIGTIT
jgi:hypothetical protein